MKTRILIFWLGAALILAALAGCGKAGPVTPQGGITLNGAITMDRAENAAIMLTVSSDAAYIESVSLSMSNLKCEGFSAGSWMTTESGQIPITEGEFFYKSDNIGEINGKFTSPTAAEGTIHFAPYAGRAECGNWTWTATGK